MSTPVFQNDLFIPPSIAARSRPTSLAALLGVFLLLIVRGTAWADGPVSVTSLHVFSQSGTSGFYPECALVQGGDGNFYGTTSRGGANSQGNIFRVTPTGDYQSLHDFNTSSDGLYPTTALVRGGDGALYGVTSYGGQNSAGTVYRITTGGSYSILYHFAANAGPGLYAGLIVGSDGNFYGTTLAGGVQTLGSVYRITPRGVFTVLYSFTMNTGVGPKTGVVQGADGTFYGTTSLNGQFNYGTFYKVTAQGVMTTLHSFTKDESFIPVTLMSSGQDGNLYGSGYLDGSGDYGSIYRFSTSGDLTILHHFVNYLDGELPAGPLLQLGDGNFYGITRVGGGNGTLFRVSPAGDFKNIYYFRDVGKYASSALVQGNDGSLYGTSEVGGGQLGGEVFKLFIHPDFFDGQTPLSNGLYSLSFAGGRYFGYYGFLGDPHFLYHFDLGYEYVIDAVDGHSGVYLYDFQSGDFLYTSPTFPFPYLYDFNLQAFLYYYPDPNNAGHYNTNGTRYFYNFSTGQTITR